MAKKESNKDRLPGGIFTPREEEKIQIGFCESCIQNGEACDGSCKVNEKDEDDFYDDADLSDDDSDLIGY